MVERLIRGLLRVKPGIGEEFRTRVRAEILRHPSLAAKFYPYQPERSSYLLERATASPLKDQNGLPVAPADLRLYGSTLEEYLEVGAEAVASMTRILEASGFRFAPGCRVLDFGCAEGIMLRHVHAVADTSELWGVDISGRHIMWCYQHLSPPFKFATTTSFPHLPFEDNYFDLVYAGSVFTHISDLAEAWLLELRRIVRPGGKLYLTVHDRHTIEVLMSGKRHSPGLVDLLRAFDAESRFSHVDYALFTINRTPGAGAAGQAQVFYDIDFLKKHWSQYLQIVSVNPEAYHHQTALVLEKVVRVKAGAEGGI